MSLTLTMDGSGTDQVLFRYCSGAVQALFLYWPLCHQSDLSPARLVLLAPLLVLGLLSSTAQVRSQAGPTSNRGPDPDIHPV